MARTRFAAIVTHWLPTIAWASLIFYLSAQPDIRLPGREFVMKDKAVHLLAYGALYALVLVGARTAVNADFVRGVGLLGVITYGFLGEIYQKFVPGRRCEANDFLADAIGAVTVYVLFIVIRRWLERSGVSREAEAG
jgi:VanZ family protein